MVLAARSATVSAVRPAIRRWVRSAAGRRSVQQRRELESARVDRAAHVGGVNAPA